MKRKLNRDLRGRGARVGWVKLRRSIRDDPSWYANEGRPATRFEALLDLYLLANWKYSRLHDRGETIRINRGQVLTSIRTLAERFGWTRERVRRWVTQLEKRDQRILAESSHRRTVITLLDYDSWQGHDLSTKATESKGDGATAHDETRPVNPPQNAPIRRRSEKEREKEETHTHESDSTSPASIPATRQDPRECVAEDPSCLSEQEDFDGFWAVYPVRINRDAARKEWDRLEPPLAEVLEALEAQKATERWRIADGRYIPHPDRWLREKRWEYLPTKAPLARELAKLDVEVPASPTEPLRSRFRKLWEQMVWPGGEIMDISLEERVSQLDLTALSAKEERVLARIGKTPEELVDLFGTSKEEMGEFGKLIDAAWWEDEEDADGVRKLDHEPDAR